MLNILLTANTMQATAALAKTQGQLVSTGKTATATGLTMKKAMLGIGLAAGAAGVALFKVGEEFDDAFDKISTRTGATGKEMRKLKGVFRDVVSDVPASFDDAATAVGDLNTRLGLSGKPLKAMAKQMTELSRITETDVETNVRSVARAFVDWEVKTKRQSKTLDGFFRLSQESGLAIDDMTASIQKFGSPLRQWGFSMDEAAAMFANFERAGVNVQTMMPGFKLAIGNMADPTAEFAKRMKELGVNIRDPHEAIMRMFELLSDGSNLSAIDKITLAMDTFGTRAGADMKEAIEQGRFELDKFLGVMRNGEETIRSQGRHTMDLKEHWQRFTNMLKVELEPVARDVFKGLGDLMKEVTTTFKKEGLSGVLDLLLQKLSDAVPKMLELGKDIAVALVKGFLNAPVLAQLAVGGWLLTKFGGMGGVGGLGSRIGSKFGMSFGGAGGPIAVAGIIAALEGAKFGQVVADSMKGDISMAEGAVMALEGGNFDKRIENLKATDDAINKHLIQQWVKAKAVTVEQGAKMIQVLKDVNQQAANVAQKNAERQGFGFARALSNDGKLLKPELNKVLQQLQALPPKARDIASQAMVNMAKLLESQGKLPEGAAKRLRDAIEDQFGQIPKDADKAGSDTAAKMDKWLKLAADKGDEHSKALRDRVSENINGKNGLTKKIGEGLGAIVTMTNNALAAFGVKKLAFDLAGAVAAGASQNNQRGGIIHAQRGAMLVGGTGNGDKVPAMLEPGEVVINKKAVAAMGGARKANAINRMIPRFASGGTVPGDTAGLHPGILGLVNGLYQRFGGSVSSGLRGADAGSLHSTGQAADYVPGNWAGASSAVNAVGSKLLEGIYNPSAFGGSPVSWDTGQHVSPSFWGAEWGNHLDHIHLAIADGVGAAIGAAAEQIKRVMLQGPDGPLKSMGQAALDKVRSAANNFLSKQTGSTGDTNGMAPISGSGDVERVFADVAKRLSTSKTATLALGMAGYAESGMRDLSYGDSTSQGALQLLSSTAAALNVSPHDEAAIASLFFQRGFYGRGGANSLAAQGLPAHLVAQGVQGSADASGSNYAAQRGPAEGWMRRYGLQAGGIIQKLRRGGIGKPGGASVGPSGGTGSGGHGSPFPSEQTYTPNPSVGVEATPRPFNQLPPALADSLFWLSAAVNALDEQITTAETLAGFFTSELGVNLGPGEKAQQIGLNQELLERLTGYAAAIQYGLATPYLDPAVISTLRTDLNLIQGVTGQGGKILTVRSRLDQLNAPDTSTTTGPDLTEQIALLSQSLLEANQRFNVSQAQYGVFAGMRAKGGYVGAGQWAIAGEQGPEVVTGPGYVHANGGPTTNVRVVIQDQRTRVFVDDQEVRAIVKDETRKQARGRPMPGVRG